MKIPPSPFEPYHFTPASYVFESADFPLAVKPMRPGMPISLHLHENFHELVVVISGHALHSFGKSVYSLEARDIFVIPPGMFHGYSQCENFDYYNLLVDFRKLRFPFLDLPTTAGYQKLFVLAPNDCAAGAAKPLQCQLDFDEFDQAVEILEQMARMQTMKEAGYQSAMVAGLTELLTRICRAGLPAGDSASSSVPASAIGALAMTLGRYCAENWSVKRMCRSCNLSRPVLFREFQKYYHTSPVRFVNQQRLRKAMSLLSGSDMTIEEIARQCGFANGSYFATVFRRQLGLTPLQFRHDPNAQTAH